MAEAQPRQPSYCIGEHARSLLANKLIGQLAEIANRHKIQIHVQARLDTEEEKIYGNSNYEK